MSSVTRLWLAFAAICTGLIHVALGATAPLLLALPLVVLGLAELAWAVLTMARGRILAPVPVLAAALVPLAAWGMLLLAAAVGGGGAAGTALDSLPLLPMAIAATFQLFAAAVVGRRVRNGARAAIPDSPAPLPAGRFLAALFAGALASGALVTPALAATDAGEGARPHGHGIVPDELLDHGGH